MYFLVSPIDVHCKDSKETTVDNWPMIDSYRD
jgi:hypothetical protein